MNIIKVKNSGVWGIVSICLMALLGLGVSGCQHAPKEHHKHSHHKKSPTVIGTPYHGAPDQADEHEKTCPHEHHLKEHKPLSHHGKTGKVCKDKDCRCHHKHHHKRPDGETGQVNEPASGGMIELKRQCKHKH